MGIGLCCALGKAQGAFSSPRWHGCPTTCALPGLASPPPQQVWKGAFGTSFPGGQGTLSVVPTKCQRNCRRTETKGQRCTVPLSQCLSSLIHKVPEGHSCKTDTAKPGSVKPSFRGCKHSKHSLRRRRWHGMEESLPPHLLKLLLFLGAAPSVLRNSSTFQQGVFFTLCKE